ncbi:NAD(P)/FAD-dependent oxidoreductase, partial [Oenococcus oeni]
QVDFIEDEVVKIDRQNKKVELKSKSTVSYDYLVTCLGFESETFGIKGADEFGLPIIDIDTALVAKKRLEETLARFQSSHDENDLHIAVCGAGFTSIEYIGELLHRLPDFVKRFNLPAEKIKIYCIEAAPKVLPMFDPKLVDYAVNYLKNQGVEFYTETSITEVKKGAVISKDKAFNANTIIWTTGVK